MAERKLSTSQPCIPARSLFCNTLLRSTITEDRANNKLINFFFSYNPSSASGFNTFNAAYPGRVTAPPPPPDYEQRVPGAITSIAAHPPHHHHHNFTNQQHPHRYNDYSGFTSSVQVPSAGPGGGGGAYLKHKPYLSSTMISIPKSTSAAYYAGAPGQDTSQHIPYRHSFDGNMLATNPAAAAAYLPPKFQENVSKSLSIIKFTQRG